MKRSLFFFFQFPKIGFDKLQVRILEVGILAVFCCSDLFSDIAAVRRFWESGDFPAHDAQQVCGLSCPFCREGHWFYGLLGACSFTLVTKHRRSASLAEALQESLLSSIIQAYALLHEMNTLRMPILIGVQLNGSWFGDTLRR